MTSIRRSSMRSVSGLASTRRCASESMVSAIEVPIAYVDIDESEDLNFAFDETLYAVCSDGQPFVLFWVDEVVDLATALVAVAQN